MSLRHLVMRLPALLIVGALLWLVLSPKPALYGHTTFSSALYDRHGQLLRLSLASDDRYRLFVPLSEISEAAINATLVYEDHHYTVHPGVNPIALIRAAWSTYISRQRVIGGSTITMQLARMRYATNTRTLGGKLTQIVHALQLERHYTKDEILEAYLNLAPYGGNIEGMGTAALIYFDTAATDLSLPQAAALAVIPQNPAKRNPSSDAGYQQMIAARQRLMDLWVTHYPLSTDSIAMLKMRLQIRAVDALPFYAPHFSQRLLQQANPDGGRYHTTLDLPMQSALERQLRHYVSRKRAVGIHNASALLIDHRSMDVLASIGSADFFDAHISGQVDGTQSKRSPGSALKPFVYALAMDQGLIHPMSMLKDAPKRFGVYTPENFDRGFMGPVFARDALIYSRNVPAIELLNRVGQDSFHQFLQDAEVDKLKDADHYGLAMILGGNELTMAELVRLYAMLANSGNLSALNTLNTLNTPSPTTADSARMATTSPPLLSAEASFLVLDMLRDNPRPDELAMRADTPDVPIAWKTGTSWAYRDAWTVGVFGSYVLAVWVGNFDGTGNPAFVGRQAAAPLFFEMADLINARTNDSHPSRHPAPDLNLRKVAVCASTGDLPGRHCPGTVPSWFIPGVSPIKISTVHRAVRIDDHSGLRTCRFDSSHSHEVVYEFWPSDLARLFEQAGISTRRPPRWDSRCSLNGQAAAGLPPQITSPEPRLTYHVRPDRMTEETLALTATTDADVKSLFWFVNDRFVASSARDEPVLWNPNVGEFTILVVDDSGRSSSSKMSIIAAQ